MEGERKCNSCNKRHVKMLDMCVICGKERTESCEICSAGFCSEECKNIYEPKHKDNCKLDWGEIFSKQNKFFGIENEDWTPKIHCDPVILLPAPWIHLSLGKKIPKNVVLLSDIHSEINAKIPIYAIKVSLFPRIMHVELNDEEKAGIKKLMTPNV